MASIAAVIRAPRHMSAIVPTANASAALAQRLTQLRLQEADAEVRAHEHKHLAALGKGVIVYDTVVGPDGSAYAVGGGIGVDLQPVPGDPEATIRKARLAIQAAYAVGEPSGADLKVAADAYQLEMAAQRELDSEQAAGGVHAWYA